MNAAQFEQATDLDTDYLGAGANEDHLPCFAHRWKVNSRVSSSKLIAAYIKLASAKDHNDVLVFSVTQQDGAAWKAWAAYAKTHPRTFKVVEGGSIHGVYLCRMYIYTKPASKRKFVKVDGRLVRR